jgi:YtkA-like
MLTKPSHLVPASVIAIASGLSLFLVLALTAGHPAGALRSQLEKPAVSSAHANTATFVVRRGPYRLRASLSPNLATRPEQLRVNVMRGGRPVGGARIRVVFSMPAMNMWRAFTSSLIPGARGLYVRQEPVLGMAGLWQLRFDVTGRAGRFSAVINARMRG